MGMTVVGLFEQAAEAQAARHDLITSNFASHEIDIKAGYAAAGQGGSTADLLNELRGDGVPEEEARLYINGVEAGDTLEILRTDDDRAQEALDIMNRHGALDIHHAHEVRTQTTSVASGAMAGGLGTAAAVGAVTPPVTTHATQTTVASAATATSGLNAQGEAVLPVVEESLAVGKREIQRGGVRVFSRTTEKPVEASVNLREEHVTVERHAVNRPVDANAINTMPEGVIEVTETAEVPVVAKEARIVEEVVVGKEATQHTETVHDTVRRTDVEVEQIAGQTTTTGTAVTGTTTTGTTVTGTTTK